MDLEATTLSPRSPELTTFESFVCGSVKDDAYKPLQPTPLNNLKDKHLTNCIAEYLA
jgi:hypothetical protein